MSEESGPVVPELKEVSADYVRAVIKASAELARLMIQLEEARARLEKLVAEGTP